MKKNRNYKRFTRSRIGNVFYSTILILAGTFTILPLIYSVVTSLKPLDELLAFPPRFFVIRPTFSNFVALPGLLSNMSIALSRYVFNSLFVSITITVLHIFVASMAAFAFTQWKSRWINIFYFVVVMALLFNSYTLGTPQYLIFSKMNILDTYWVYILPFIPSTMGVFLMKQYLEGNLPPSLIEASRIDGAGYFRVFRSIAFPLARPAWLTLMLFVFRDSWSIQASGTIFSERLKTLPMVLSQITMAGSGVASDIARSGSIMAASVLMMIPPIMVFLISQSNVMETMSSAGIK